MNNNYKRQTVATFGNDQNCLNCKQILEIKKPV